ncbi:MAG: glutamate-5-semialdehyde dehydrogenase [Erysipelotrichaceae bacterium]|nr:glutamate-5-semialdehyde dehydrogenase [Erysipelotrichaceae bacterium]
MNEVLIKAKLAKKASSKLALLDSSTKNAFLIALSNALLDSKELILKTNEIDLLHNDHLSDSLKDRLRLNSSRLDSMAEALVQLSQAEDPVNHVISETIRPNGLRIQKVSVPMGVIAMIYEARPNVTIDAAALAFKAGSAVILRGGKEALNSNKAFVSILRSTLLSCDLDPELIQLIEDPDKELAKTLMTANCLIDLLIPRGSARLIKTVLETATVPVLETGIGNCHAYVEKSADQDMALKIIVNAKCSRPSVCNSLEKVLIDEAIAETFLPKLVSKLRQANVFILGDEKSKDIDSTLGLATEEDWATEYLDLKIAIKIVKDLDEALDHIQKYSSKHSETILTSDSILAQRFLDEVDAAAVYHNASTRFTDGGEFGFSAEIGISTQKMHARGPVGLNELCSYKYKIFGEGQIR